jgi:autonomous glycyl radical cofactor GrcA
MPVDPDTCNHIWILDKSSEVVRLICAKCGKVMNP